MLDRARLALFIAAVTFQVAILALIPAQKIGALRTGRTVFLKVVPVDPYNILSGYHAILGYEISRPHSFPGAHSFQPGDRVYAVVEEGADGLWHPVLLETDLPPSLPPSQVAMRGTWEGARITYGIEEFYVPEARRFEIDRDLRDNIGEARVEVRVAPSGEAALVSLCIGDRVYR